MKFSSTKVTGFLGLMALAAVLAACGGGASSSVAKVLPEPKSQSPDLETGQAAVRVIGQPDFESFFANQGGAAGLQTINTAFGAPVAYQGKLYVPDTHNNRILVFNQGIPEVNGESASFVIGQDSDSDSTARTTAGGLDAPTALLIYEGRLVVADWENNRVLIWNQVPVAGTADADLVLGQSDMDSDQTSCSASGMNRPTGLAMYGDKLLVSDVRNDRVLVWNSWPETNGQPADDVIGQDDLVSCSANRGETAVTGRGFDIPAFLWSDGERLAIPDLSNNRVLIWNSWPGTASDMREADLVLGQLALDANLSQVGQSGMAGPEAVLFDGERMFVSDSSNNRVLIWNGFPLRSGQAADIVLGQADFETNDIPDISPTSFDYPGQLSVINGKLFVPDWDGNRVLIFE